jgi:hypothetical protein
MGEGGWVCDRGLWHFLGKKLATICSFVGGRIIVQQKNLESGM